jgi:hypothetical protein
LNLYFISLALLRYPENADTPTRSAGTLCWSLEKFRS